MRTSLTLISDSINNNINSSSKNQLLSMQASAFTIFDMLARAQLTSQAIYIVAKLRIADYLKDGPKDIEELAEETKTHPDSLYRLLRMLSSIGIFAETKGEEKEKNKNKLIKGKEDLS